MKKSIYLLFLFGLSINIFADNFDKPSYEEQINSITKSKLNKFFSKIENQSVTTDKNLLYYRPDTIKRRKANKFVIWTRSDVVSYEGGSYYYIIPEGYRIIMEKEGEIFIDYEPSKEEENLIIQ